MASDASCALGAPSRALSAKSAAAMMRMGNRIVMEFLLSETSNNSIFISYYINKNFVKLSFTTVPSVAFSTIMEQGNR